MIEALTAVRCLLGDAGFGRLQYKAVPSIYHRAPAQDDLYALFRLGARRYRCDLSTCVDLHARLPVSERRRRALKKAKMAGFRIGTGRGVVAQLWQVIEDNLNRKHGIRPTHSLAEILMLAERFPDEIEFVAASLFETVEAGVVLFHAGPTVHAQYIASSVTGYELSALDLLIEHCISRAVADGARYFDFGISTEAQGMVLNDGLYRFKSEFGGSGIVHDFYELDL